MAETAQEPEGLPASARNLARSVLGLVRTRLELFALELQEERLRTARLLVWLGVATTLVAAGILVATGALALLLWRTAGYAGLITVAVGTLALAAGLFWFLRRQIVEGPEPFEATIAEFKKDAQWLHEED
ncbi:MAG TPA: phage holin family protein [Opitutus sp.]|nr:phage holin family protein [Opitutus sp.]